MKEKDRRKTILKDKLYDIEVHDGLPSWEEFAHNRSVIYEKRRNSTTRRKLVLITRYAAAFLLLSGFVFGIYKINSFKIKNNITVNSINNGTDSIDTVSLSDDSSRSSGNETSKIMEQNIAGKDSEELNISNNSASNNYPVIKPNIDTTGDKIEILPTPVVEKNSAKASETSMTSLTGTEEVISTVDIYSTVQPVYILPIKVQTRDNILIDSKKETIRNFQNSYSSRVYNEYEYRNKWDYKLSTDIQIMNKYSFINNQSTDNYTPKPPLTINIGIYRNFGYRISIGSGVGYESLRSTYLEYGVTTVTQKSVEAHYIGIPVILSYYFTRNQIGPNIYITGNINAEKLIHANSTEVYKFPSNMMGDTITQYIDHKGFMISYSLGTGIEYNFTPRFGLFAEPNLNYYFYTIDQPLSVRTRAPLSINIRFGAKF
jgi:hypothetical protein